MWNVFSGVCVWDARSTCHVDLLHAETEHGRSAWSLPLQTPNALQVGKPSTSFSESEPWTLSFGDMAESIKIPRSTQRLSIYRSISPNHDLPQSHMLQWGAKTSTRNVCATTDFRPPGRVSFFEMHANCSSNLDCKTSPYNNLTLTTRKWFPFWKCMHIALQIRIARPLTGRDWDRENYSFMCLFEWLRLGHVLFFLCFSSPARVAFGWKIKKKPQRQNLTNIVDLALRSVTGGVTLTCCTCRLVVEWMLQFLHSYCEEKGKNFPLLRSLMEEDDWINVSPFVIQKAWCFPFMHIRQSFEQISMPSCDDQAAVFSERVWSWRPKSHHASYWNCPTWTLLREMRSCFDKTRMCVWLGI